MVQKVFCKCYYQNPSVVLNGLPFSIVAGPFMRAPGRPRIMSRRPKEAGRRPRAQKEGDNVRYATKLSNKKLIMYWLVSIMCFLSRDEDDLLSWGTRPS